MKNKFDITTSIVLFKENLNELSITVDCFLKTPLKKKLFLIDNTPTKEFEGVFNHKEIEYIPVGKNIGFGSGHNLILSRIKKQSNFHLILNPDVYFNPSVIPNLIAKLERHEVVSLIAPKVLFPNGEFQNSCRRYPKILELIARRFTFLAPLVQAKLKKGNYFDINLKSSFFADCITGCFHLYKTDDFIELNGFDERYFLYMEDIDICRKIEKLDKKKLYYPKEEITHVLKQGSLKQKKLFFTHTYSAIKYFMKWGFFRP